VEEERGGRGNQHRYREGGKIGGQDLAQKWHLKRGQADRGKEERQRPYFVGGGYSDHILLDEKENEKGRRRLPAGRAGGIREEKRSPPFPVGRSTLLLAANGGGGHGTDGGAEGRLKKCFCRECRGNKDDEKKARRQNCRRSGQRRRRGTGNAVKDKFSRRAEPERGGQIELKKDMAQPKVYHAGRGKKASLGLKEGKDTPAVYFSGAAQLLGRRDGESVKSQKANEKEQQPRISALFPYGVGYGWAAYSASFARARKGAKTASVYQKKVRMQWIA